MNKKCAYCGNPESLTREHLWPTSLIQRFEEQMITYNGRIDKCYESEGTIKDVCPKCNNNKLSVLDNYLCSLYEKNLKNIISPGQPARLYYNYDLLLRSLLKISYNVTRSFKKREDIIDIHRKFSKYILGDELVRPKGIRLHLQIVTSAELKNRDTDQIITTLDPGHLRCGQINYDGILSEKIFIRMVAIKSYYFYIFISKCPISNSKYRSFIQEISNWKTPYLGIYLNPSSSSVHIPVKKTTYLHPRLLGSMLTAGINYSLEKNPEFMEYFPDILTFY